MTMPAPEPQAPLPPSMALIAWSLLDEAGHDEATKQVAEDGWDYYETMMPHLLEQAGLQDSPPEERKKGYRQRPIGKWEILKNKYRSYYEQDMRDFRELDPEGAYVLEHVLLQLELVMAEQQTQAVP